MNNNFKNKIINGDSLEELKKIPNETFDLIFADPPYNLQLKKLLTRPDRSKVSAVNDKWERRSISDIGSHRAKYRSNIGGCPDAKYWHILAYIGVTAILLEAFF